MGTFEPQMEEVRLQSDGLALAGCVFRAAPGVQPAPGLLICHGFASCKEHHVAFARQAAQAGFVVLAFDFRGHGASEGCLDSRTVHDIAAALRFLRADAQVDAGRIAVRGSSMGGYFALHAAARWPDLAAVVAICPTTEALFSTLLHDLSDPSSPATQAYRATATFPRVMGCDLTCWLEKADVIAAAGRLAPRPLLLIHCQGDAQVPPAISADLYTAAHDPKTFWLLEDGDHRFAQHDPAVGARSLAWLRQGLGARDQGSGIAGRE